MKKFIPLFICLSFNLKAQSGYSIPETPRQIEFANVVVNLDSYAQKTVNNHVTSLLTPQNSYLDSKLELMQWYFPYIEAILEKENVPDDLKYLAVQESNLKPDALSSSAAVGFWQFKEPTGKELGLRIDNNIDERKYLDASTKAAARYFKKNNIIFKNWISCIYAYNQGPTGASKEIPDSWSYASEVTFTKDTPDYLLKSLAHRIAYEHRLNRLKPSSTSLLQYPVKGKSLAQIAVELKVELSELRKYNAWLYAAAIPTSKIYNVLIPVGNGKKTEVQNKIDKRLDLIIADKGYPILTRKTMVTTSDDDPILYNINQKEGILALPGDEVAQLSKKGNISITYFIKFNDLTDRDMIKTGKVYYLQRKSKKGPLEFHSASRGQTFWDISQDYGIRLKNLLKYNRLKSPETLQSGRVVWLQQKRPANQPVEIIQELIETAEPRKIPIATSYEKDKEIEVETLVEPIQKSEKPKVLTNQSEIKKEPEIVVVKKFEPKPTETGIVKTQSPPNKPEIKATQTHLVRQGETLYAISKKYNLTVSDLRRLNNISKNDILQYGQTLNVTKAKTSRSKIPLMAIKTSSVNKPASPETITSHSVKKGETLFSISRKYEMTVKQLQQLNGLRNNTISIDQKLTISVSGVPAPKLHAISRGETLFSISQKYNISVGQLKAWNNLRSNTIRIGQQLKIEK
ncbi:MAG: membrane-bound lytic murein transglycosylase D [Arcticibacterium sp.]|jgi:membrane-bound lytic murein transglycosylase D